MNFTFAQFQAQLHYQTVGAVDRLRANVDEQDTRLVPNPQASSSNVIVVQSPTGTTRGQLASDRASLQSDFFDEHQVEGSHDLRFRYIAEKVEALLRWAERAEVSTTMLGLILVARSPVPRERRARVVEKAAGAFGLSAIVDEGAVPFDFVARASRVVDPWYFTNTQVSWYQVRSVSVGEPLVPGQTVPVRVSDWEMRLEEEGLEIRFDWNNKHALFNGKFEWSADDHLAILGAMATSVPRVLARIRGLLGAEGLS